MTISIGTHFIPQSLLEQYHDLQCSKLDEDSLRTKFTSLVKFGSVASGRKYSMMVRPESMIKLWHGGVSRMLGAGALSRLKNSHPVMKESFLHVTPHVPSRGKPAYTKRTPTILEEEIGKYLKFVEIGQKCARLQRHILYLLGNNAEPEPGEFSVWRTPRVFSTMAVADVNKVLGHKATVRLCNAWEPQFWQRLVISDRVTGTPLGWHSPEWLAWVRSPGSDDGVVDFQQVDPSGVRRPAV